MEEGSDTVGVPPMSNEDYGFEHVSAPNSGSSEEEEDLTVMPTETEVPDNQVQEEPDNETEVAKPPPTVEDVPKTGWEPPPQAPPQTPPQAPPQTPPQAPPQAPLQSPAREDQPKKPTVTEQCHPKGHLGFLRPLNDDILNIIYWRNVYYSGGVLVVVLAFLLTVTINPLLHSVALALLATFVVALTYSAGKIAWDSFHNEPLANPFQSYLDQECQIPEEVFICYAKVIAMEVNCSIKMLIRLVFFADVFTSLKFLVVLYIVSYFTPYFTLLSVLYLGTLVIFTVPKVYELYQAQIDANISLVRSQISFVWNKVTGMIPFLPKKSKVE